MKKGEDGRPCCSSSVFQRPCGRPSGGFPTSAPFLRFDRVAPWPSSGCLGRFRQAVCDPAWHPGFRSHIIGYAPVDRHREETWTESPTIAVSDCRKRRSFPARALSRPASREKDGGRIAPVLNCGMKTEQKKKNIEHLQVLGRNRVANLSPPRSAIRLQRRADPAPSPPRPWRARRPALPAAGRPSGHSGLRAGSRARR